MNTKSRWRLLPLVLLLIFAIGYNLFRVGLFAMSINGSLHSDKPLSPAVNSFVVYSELVIGLVGLLAVSGLLLSRSWGFWSTIVIGAYAIVFDGWSFVAVKGSALAGVIPPLVIFGGLVAYRRRFLHPEAQLRSCIDLRTSADPSCLGRNHGSTQLARLTATSAVAAAKTPNMIQLISTFNAENGSSPK